jgi:hypothetical protein
MLIINTRAHETFEAIAILCEPKAVMPQKMFHDTVIEGFFSVDIARAKTDHKTMSILFRSYRS